MEIAPCERLDIISAPSGWSCLCSDLTELILSYLPIVSIVRASSVCKFWRSVATRPSFAARLSASKKPWFFLCGQNNVSCANNQAFGYDPEIDEWIRLPASLFPHISQVENLVGSGGFFFTTSLSSHSSFCYAPVLRATWRQTQPLRFSRYSPLIGVFDGGGDGMEFKFIVVGGVQFFGGLVDIEDKLAVEIYDPRLGSWELCPPLPSDFSQGSRLSSAVFKGQFFVYDVFSGFVSSFDLTAHEWSGVQTLRPPGVLFSFLVACKEQLVLAGLCSVVAPQGNSFNLWKVDQQTMEFSEIAIMPQELLNCLIDSDEDSQFACLKCVGHDDLVYVFNDSPYGVYPAYVCEIRGSATGCTWKKLPHLPPPVNRYHRMISFCSTVPLASVL
ncbi:F-box/kelch-repeat protein At3g24760 [Aristolochia californica]|uniref:F-box/kelch-repeat protein At3g24760 n=1 Tax=Aristolochia californica TaxID=171875 RepID=UPI0035E2B752